MALKQSKNYNENYAAKLCRLENNVLHPNADRLTGWIIDGFRIWTTKDYEEGNIGIYFPVGCAINKDLLAYLGLFRKSLGLNIDPKADGFFEAKGRVKALKLRGEPSEGFFIRWKDFQPWLEYIGKADFQGSQMNTYFDSWDDVLICEKYIPKTKTKGTNLGGSKAKKKDKDRILKGQHEFHYSTGHLGRNMHKFSPEDKVVITKKLHGCSANFHNILVERELPWYEKLLSWFGVNIQKAEYKPVIASRKVIKQVGSSKSKTFANAGSWYKTNVWLDAYNSHFAHWLPKGYSVYAEIVGYTKDGAMIQKDYNYGCDKDAKVPYEVYVYRITRTNPDGDVIELSWDTVQQICEKYGVKTVPELYNGRLYDLHLEHTNAPIFADLNKFIPAEQTEEEFNKSFRKDTFALMANAYLEKDCTMCIGKTVPDEGICIRNESTDKKAYKLKSFRFTKLENDSLDSSEVDMETEES